MRKANFAKAEEVSFCLIFVGEASQYYSELPFLNRAPWNTMLKKVLKVQ